MIDASDREDLDALLGSAGWTRLVQLARDECRNRKDVGTRQAADESNDIAALHKLRQVLAFEMGVEFVLNLPAQWMARSDRAEKVAQISPGRRGPL